MFAKYFRDRRNASMQADKALKDAPFAKHFQECDKAVRNTFGFSLVPEQFECARGLIDGRIVEMQTGEGKTVAAVPAAAHLAKAGKKVHILTANDYLAQRDAEWMGPVYAELGLSTAWIRQESSAEQRRAAYAADITYIAATEAGFDHLRDSRALSLEERVQQSGVQQSLGAVIVDEADCILIDEARIPLILAGESHGLANITQRAGEIARQLHMGADFERAPEGTSFNLTPHGSTRVERLLNAGNLYAPANVQYLTAILHSLNAHHLFQRDHDYMVQSEAIIPIDAYKGRGSRERRWPAGLHGALEEKERLSVREPGRVLASVTMQNYIQLYEHICGMTGTAATQAEELDRVYGLQVQVIPTHKPMIREDRADRLYRTRAEKHAAILSEIRTMHATGRPILIGTSSVAESEQLSFAMAGIPHQVLNAKNEDLEASIIAEAGRRGAVTISTNMAGRGVDIRLEDGVAALGGLHIIGTTRNDSRRIDHQLRGRSGRQGDPGSSQFLISLEDELFQRLLDPGKSISTQADCESLQRRAEGRHMDARLFLNKYEAIIEGFRHSVLARRAEIEEENGPEMIVWLDAIDESWACFLEEIEHLKSHITFHNLDGRNPYNTFLLQADELCKSFWSFVDDEVAKRKARGGQPTRRGATWTYLSVDMPFGTLSERIARGLARKLRSGKLWG